LQVNTAHKKRLLQAVALFDICKQTSKPEDARNEKNKNQKKKQRQRQHNNDNNPAMPRR